VGKRLVLNDNGQTLLPQAVRLLEAALQIEEGFKRQGVARLRVGCSTTIGNYILPLLIERLAEQAAGLQIDVILGNSADIARQAAQLTIDVGLIEGPCRQANVQLRPWFEDELVIVAAPNHPLAAQQTVTAAELQAATWLIREQGSGTADEVQQWLLPQLGDWQDSRRIGSSEAIKRLVAAGVGISCLSYWVVSDALADGRLKRLQHPFAPHKRQLHLVHHRDKFISRALEVFLRTAEAFAAAQADSQPG